MFSSAMDSACIRHTDLPGTSRLFADFSYQFERVAGLYRHDPHDPASFAAAAQEIDYPETRRAAMAQVLAAQGNGGDLLDRFSQPGTVAVVTGQQVGLFSGPAYTIYKALTAIRLAEDLSARGIPAVPLFWMATEDHDFAEAAHTWVCDSSFHPVRLSVKAEDVQAETGSRSRPAGSIVLTDPPLDELRAALSGFPFGEEVVAAVQETYPRGVTLGGGFRALLQRLLGRVGALTLDPLDPRVRAIGAPLMADALKQAGDLHHDLIERNGTLNTAGYHAQVLVDGKTSLFFLLDKSERITLRRKDSEYAALAGRAAEVSPNALLRPVWQDYLLPTVAYVGGPAEIAYFAQARVIYDRLLGRMPVVVSRCGFTLLDARAAKLLQRYGLTLCDILVPEEALKERVARALAPDAVTRSFAETSAAVGVSLDRLGATLEGFDHTLARALAKSRAKISYQLEKTQRKIERETLRRDARAAGEARRLSDLLYPHRHLQERFYSILPFLAAHGLDAVERIHDALRPDCTDHRVLTL
jgi:bacillithiol biosynthesis cysteine-adding enzyme BshC